MNKIFQATQVLLTVMQADYCFLEEGGVEKCLS